ncbi:hypothetical protein FSST1_010279 [Fusarium sambucinum]
MDHSPIHHHDVPGTVRLIDVSGMNSGGPHDSQHKDIVFVPRPSSDPKDPLNWTYRRKLLAVSMAYLYVLRTGIVTSLQYSACLIWQPIALTYGRRGVYLLTMLLAIPIMTWTAYSSSAGVWFAHRVLIGIIVSPIESLCEATVFDLFFAHNRGTYMGLYVSM